MYTKHDQRIDGGSAQETLGLLSACFRRLSQVSLPHVTDKVVPVFEQNGLLTILFYGPYHESTSLSTLKAHML